MPIVRDVVRHVVFGAREEPPLSPVDASRDGSLLANAPPGFLFGAASSAHQVEGSLVNDWTEWERGHYPDGRAHVVDGARSTVACDSWNRWPDDVRCLGDLGANAYRLGVEWARLEPQPGAWDGAAVERYREMLSGLRAAGVNPMVTLWHFTLPTWVAARGGWEWDGAVAAFAGYAERCARAFGDLVDLWCTVNEPNVYAMKSYAMGDWAPGHADVKRAARVQAALLRAHAAAARVLREIDVTDADGDGHATRIGFAQHLRTFQPATRSPADFVLARLSSAFFNDVFPDSIARGRIRVVVPATITIDEPCDGLAGSIDWLGINYYSRDRVRFDPKKPFVPKLLVGEGRPVNDLGWDVWPEGMFSIVRDASKRWGFPILITENGTADASGVRRPDYLRSHVAALVQAMAAGADVRGYLHWSLLDNFEWSEGWTGRFGLFSVDFAEGSDRTRRATPAVEVFRTIAKPVRGKPGRVLQSGW